MYLQKQGFKRGLKDNNIYIKFDNDDFLITIVYVDETIFGSDLEEMGHKFIEEMKKKLNVYVREVDILPWATSYVNKPSYIHLPIQVFKRYVQNIWYGETHRKSTLRETLLFSSCLVSWESRK